MKWIYIKNSVRTLYVVIYVALVLSACTHLTREPNPADLQQAYARAIKDAEIAEPDEINRNLVAIVPSNKDLTRKKDSGEVLVTTWTSWDGYDEHVGRPMNLSREVWVTVFPEVKQFCRELNLVSSQVPLRLKQLLGLPPNDMKTKFAEIWVDPDDLFRPSPDPEISDNEASLDFPVSNRFVTVSNDHMRWFHDMKQKSYGADGYPWTRLGYTYDWGNPRNEIGLSEFVIRAGATVTIRGVTATLDYCNN